MSLCIKYKYVPQIVFRSNIDIEKNNEGFKMDEKILEIVENDKIKFILLQFSDICGIAKNVTIPVSELKEALERGIWFDGSSIEGFARIHESDMFLKPDTSTYTVIPWMADENIKTARFICDVHNPDGTVFEGDPRYILKRVIKEAAEMGYS